jgi:ribosome-associated translation inhibitor RaiA
MQIRINDPGHQIKDELAQQFERETLEALATHAARLTRVEIHIKDLNASKGGVDKRCLIEARPRGLDPLVAEHEERSLHEAFRGALDKLQRVLARRFDRLSSRER